MLTQNILCILAQAAPGQPGGSMMPTFLMLGLAVVFFYFIIWRPEQKRRKTAEEMRASLKKGDRVVAMGLVGKVDKIQDQTVILKMTEGAKVEVLNGAITEVQKGVADEETSS